MHLTRVIKHRPGREAWEGVQNARIKNPNLELTHAKQCVLQRELTASEILIQNPWRAES